MPEVSHHDFSETLNRYRESPDHRGQTTLKSKPSKPSTVITGNRRTYPPIVVPEQSPREIMRGMLTFEERADVARLLLKYQKSGIGWDDWIIKNWPEAIAARWKPVIEECRRNGFVHPRAVGDKIVWHQILTQPSSLRYVNQCTICPVLHDECKGKVNDNHEFKPCWEARGAQG
jgi:hypothetical protein